MDKPPTTRWVAPKIVHAACWAHARRKFIDAVKLNASDKESIGIVEKMDQLFRVDWVARETGLTLEARHALPNEESKPILERIKISIDAACRWRARLAEIMRHHGLTPAPPQV